MIVYGCAFSVIVRPTTVGSAPNARRQNPSLSSTTRVLPPGRSSSSRKLRPSTGEIFSVGGKVAVTLRPGMTSASPFDVQVNPALVVAASDSNARDCERQSRKLGCDAANVDQPRSTLLSQTRTRRSGSVNGSGRSITALTTLKMAVVAPTPNASVRAPMAVKPGLLLSAPAAYRRSWRGFVIVLP